MPATNATVALSKIGLLPKKDEASDKKSTGLSRVRTFSGYFACVAR